MTDLPEVEAYKKAANPHRREMTGWVPVADADAAIAALEQALATAEAREFLATAACKNANEALAALPTRCGVPGRVYGGNCR